MKRNTTVLVVFALLILADLVWLRLVLDGRESLEGVKAAMAYTGQGLAAATFLTIVLVALRKKYARQKKPAKRPRSFAVLQPLRRLFVSVLS